MQLIHLTREKLSGIKRNPSPGDGEEHLNENTSQRINVRFRVPLVPRKNLGGGVAPRLGIDRPTRDAVFEKTRISRIAKVSPDDFALVNQDVLRLHISVAYSLLMHKRKPAH
jgi:hypothetical protein